MNQSASEISIVQNMERISSIILHENDLNVMLRRVLEEVHDIFHCDRVWLLYECDLNTSECTFPFECTSNEFLKLAEAFPVLEVTSEIHNLILEVLNTSQPVTHGSKGSSHLSESLEVKSQMVTAIYPRVGKAWMFGLHQCSTEREWTDVEIELFRQLGVRLANALSLNLLNEKLQESQAHYRGMLEDQTDVICRWKNDGVLTFVNEAFCNLFEMDEDDLVGTNMYPLIPEDGREIVRQQLQLLSAENPVIVREDRSIDSDGNENWQSWHNRAILNDENQVIEYQSVGRDITQLKLKEKELEQQLEFEQLIAQISTVFINCPPKDIDVRIHDALQEIGEFLTTDRASILQFSNGFSLCSQTHEWCKPGVESLDDQLQNLPSSDHQGWVDQLKVGEPLYVADPADMPDDTHFTREFISKLKLKSVLHVPMILQGELIGILAFSSHKPIYQSTFDNSVLLKIVGQAFVNALDRQQVDSERERLIHQLEMKNNELEQFTYTVSHDLKSPLITIKSFLGMLKQDIEANDTEEIEEDLTHISKASTKMTTLLDELLTLSRIGRLDNISEEFSFEELLQETLELLEVQRFEKEIEIVNEYSWPTIFGDRSRLGNVLQNLINNAIKFCPDNGQGRIKLSWEDIPSEESYCFFIEDNGLGIDPAYHQKVFGLFEKLDAADSGTGVGLAIVKRIIEQHQGQIWVESQGLNRGSKFCFKLPTTQEVVG